jgi:GNAT superfamily N-acetyltransferase
MILTPVSLGEFPIDALEALSVAAGWNQTAADWRRILRLAPDLCFGLVVDATLAASATAYIHSSGVAWIGMVLTLPEFRNRGLARHLLTHLIGKLQHVPTIGLDATHMGAPLYRSLGFVDHCPIERWARPGTPLTITPSATVNTDPLLADLALDSQILRSPDATLYLRPGRHANYLGPFTASSEDAAAWLLTQIPTTASLYWDLFSAHPFASRLATAQGLAPARELIRMYRGPAIPPSPSTIGIAGFEFG